MDGEIAFQSLATDPPYREIRVAVFTLAPGGELQPIWADGPPRLGPGTPRTGTAIAFGFAVDYPAFYADRVRLCLYDRAAVERTVLTADWDRSCESWEWLPDGSGLTFAAEDDARRNCSPIPPPAAPRPSPPGRVADRPHPLADGVGVVPAPVPEPTGRRGRSPPPARRPGSPPSTRPCSANRVGPGGGGALPGSRRRRGPDVPGVPAAGSTPPGSGRWCTRSTAGRTGSAATCGTTAGTCRPSPPPGTWWPLSTSTGRPRGAPTSPLRSGRLGRPAHGGRGGGHRPPDRAGVHRSRPRWRSPGTLRRLPGRLADRADRPLRGGDLPRRGYRPARSVGHRPHPRPPVPFGGLPWDGLDDIRRWSPTDHSAGMATPTLVIHGERDYRVVVTQGLELYGILQDRGAPSRLVDYPDEAHWILKPQNSLHWYGEFLGWLERHECKGRPEEAPPTPRPPPLSLPAAGGGVPPRPPSRRSGAGRVPWAAPRKIRPCLVPPTSPPGLPSCVPPCATTTTATTCSTNRRSPMPATTPSSASAGSRGGRTPSWSPPTHPPNG